MDPMPIVIGVAVAVGVGISVMITGKRNQALAPKIEAHLAANGPSTLQQLADGLGMGSFMARGKVVMALNDLVMRKTIVVTDAPAGTPQLQKVNHIKYSLAARA